IKNEIDEIIENNRSKKRSNYLHITEEEENQNDAQQSQDNREERSYAAFEYYHQLRIKRLNIEAELSCYFLEMQEVEGKIDDLHTLS
ncbi:unnamed protein product, partial [Rotaria sordida]